MDKKIKNQSVSKAYLNEAFKQHSKVILEAVDYGFKGIGHKFQENEKVHQKLEKKIDETHNLINKYVNAQESFKQEFKIIKYRNGKVEKIIQEKLGVEIN